MRNRRNKRSNTFSIRYLKNITRILGILLIIFSLIFIVSIIQKSDVTDFNNIQHLSSTNEISNTPVDSSNTNSSNDSTSTEIINDITINMAFTGDIMCHNTMYKDAYNSATETYDFTHFFENVKYYLQTADVTIGNLETTFAGSNVGYSSYPTFNTPEILAKNLKKAGFDIVSTANNHCMDKGYKGLESTISYLDEADIAHTGTYTSEENQNTILVKNVKGIKIAFVSFTYGTNGIPVPSDKSYAVNFLDNETMTKQINLAKAEEPDIICALVHWGNEYQTTPNSNQKEIAKFLMDNGVNLIIGNHPHVPQPMVLTKNSSDEDVFIAYSLGNFMADQNKPYTRDSVILNLSITKDSKNNITINNYNYVPIYIYKNNSLKTKKFSILDINNIIESYDAGYDTSIGSSMYNKLKTELQNIKKIVEKEI